MKDPVTQLTVVRKLSREWRAALSDRELSVLLYILDHTVMWGRASYRFTYRGFAEGTPVSVGMGKAASKLREAIRELENKGAVTIAPNRRDGLSITPNLEWQPMIAVPKCLADRNGAHQNGRADRPETGTLPARNRADIIGEYLEQSPRTVAPGCAIAAGDAAVEKSESEGPTIRVRTRQKPVAIAEPKTVALPTHRPAFEINGQGELLMGDRPLTARVTLAPVSAENAVSARRRAVVVQNNPAAIWKTWSTAWAATYADMPAAVCLSWTKRDVGMVRAALCNRWDGGAEDLHAFVEWLVTDWRQIMGSHFAWMKQSPPPMYPTLQFVLGQRDRLIPLFHRRAVDRHRDGLSGEERRRFDLTIRQGKTEDEARIAIAEDRAKAKLRKEMEESERKARQKLSEARLTEANAEKARREAARMTAAPAARRATPHRPIQVSEMTEAKWEEGLQLIADLVKLSEELHD